jgi:hypothetical protein
LREAAARERQRQVLAQLQKGPPSQLHGDTEGNERRIRASALTTAVVDNGLALLKENGRPYTPPLDGSSTANLAPQVLFPHLFPSLEDSQKNAVGPSSHEGFLDNSWETSPSAWPEATWDVQEKARESNWNITGQDEQGCVICMEREKNALLLPCGHLSACMQCIEMVKKSTKPLCPICRQAIEDVIQIS